jgi:hypothetical protein
MSETIASEVPTEQHIDSCPDCGDVIVNGQGVYTCVDDDCQWIGVWTEVGWERGDIVGNFPSTYG